MVRKGLVEKVQKIAPGGGLCESPRAIGYAHVVDESSPQKAPKKPSRFPTPAVLDLFPRRDNRPNGIEPARVRLSVGRPCGSKPTAFVEFVPRVENYGIGRADVAMPLGEFDRTT